MTTIDNNATAARTTRSTATSAPRRAGRTRGFGAAIAIAAAIGTVAVAQHAKPDAGAKAPSDGITGVDLLGDRFDPSPEGMQQAMAEWIETTKPTAGHKVLARSVGEWKTRAEMYMSQDAPPMISEGTATNTMIMGGRYVQSNYNADFMGQPFEGMSLMGYDNIRNQFTMLWVDSLSTAPITTKGQLSADGRVITCIGDMDEPMTGEIGKPVKWVTTYEGDDTIIFEAIETIYGEEFTVMRVTYTREK